MSRFSIVAALLTVGLLGCGGGAPKRDLPPLYPVKGKALRGGVPLSSGLLSLIPSPETPESRDWVINAEINPDGTFEIQSLHSLSQKRSAGAPAGTFRVNVTITGGDQTQGGRIQNLSLPYPITIKTEPNEITIEFPKGK